MKKIIIPALVLCASSAYAQSTLNACGHTTTHTTTIHAYSIAEMCLVGTASTAEFITTQGVLQTEEMNKENEQATNALAELYPNPTSGIVFAKLNLPEKATLFITIFDNTGKELYYNSQVKEKGIVLQEFDLSNYTDAVYFVKIQAIMATHSNNFQFKLIKQQ
jgi:hypothetical protein